MGRSRRRSGGSQRGMETPRGDLGCPRVARRGVERVVLRGVKMRASNPWPPIEQLGVEGLGSYGGDQPEGLHLGWSPHSDVTPKDKALPRGTSLASTLVIRPRVYISFTS